jgi:hypothetical protein
MVREEHFDMKAEDFERNEDIIRGKMYVVKAPRAGKKKTVGLLPVFNLYDASRIDIKRLQLEKKEAIKVVAYRSNYVWNRRILDAIERSVERYKHRPDYKAYLSGIKRQDELVREYYGLEDRDSVDPFNYLIRDNLDRQDNVPQARLTFDLQPPTVTNTKEESDESSGVFPQKAVDTTLSSNSSVEEINDNLIAAKIEIEFDTMVGDDDDLNDDEQSAADEKLLLTDDLLSNLEKGVYDDHIANVMTGKARSKRHSHFIKIQSSNKLDFSYDSEITKIFNVDFVAQSQDVRFADLTRKVCDAKMSRLKGLKKVVKDNASFMDKYITYCLQPEIIIKFIMNRDSSNYEAAQKTYLMRRVTVAKMDRIQKELDANVKLEMESRRYVFEEDDEQIMQRL